MNAFLLTWNPKVTDWATYIKDREQLLRKGFLDGRWSCGKTKLIRNGDRVYLTRQGLEPKGIVATGHATSDWFSAPRWNDESRTCNYVKVRWDALLDFKNLEIISRGWLSHINDVYWDSQMSGISVSKETEKLLEVELARLNKHGIYIPEELPGTSASYIVGTAEKILVNKYERDPRARRLCIKHYRKNNKIKCEVCNFDFEKKYGDIGIGFIHIHHIVPLSQIKEKYKINPMNDLVPVCANCHAMLHQKQPVPLSVDELKHRMKVARQSQTRT